MQAAEYFSDNFISKNIKSNVEEELVELEEISSEDIRKKVVDAWAYSLEREGYERISDIQGSGGPDFLVLKNGTQLDHIRGVARLSMRYGDELKLLHPDLPLDRDVLIAGALIHDVGKTLEYNESKREFWSKNQHRSGWPATRHPVHGWHVCLTVGLPEEIAHIAASHSREGGFIVRSLEGVIVHHCDHAFWQALLVGNQLLDAAPEWRP